MSEELSKHQRIRSAYQLDGWGDGYFDIQEGEVIVSLPGKSRHTSSLQSLAEKASSEGLKLPLLIRFPDILKDRLDRLGDAFDRAISQRNYKGQAHIIYPIKVNQHKDVISTLLHHKNDCPVGLEVGSKAEMAAVLSMLESNQPKAIVCNGYKDGQMVRLGLFAQKLGHSVFFVIEKPSELSIILKEARALKVHQPLLGVRVRLCSVGKGNWQNTGGEKSKFGLSVTHLLKLIECLKKENALDCLKLLHVHLGSQVSDLEDLKRGVRECAQFYVQLRALGVPIETIDVGGGLAVDYDGSHSTRYFSKNYTIPEYAAAIVEILNQACEENHLPHPTIMTESGRSLTAHHAVLITNVISRETVSGGDSLSPLSSNHPILLELWSLYEQITSTHVEPLYRSAEGLFLKAKEAYLKGELTLEERSDVEQVVALIHTKLKQAIEVDTSLAGELQERLAEKWVCNFSVFQSTPDVWGIDQVFPILPLSGLTEPPAADVVIQDITCDSDGRIETYVSCKAGSTTLPVPKQAATSLPFIGIFLVGAYQEILGDMHNLFGDTDSASVELDDNGDFQLKNPIRGDTVRTLLTAVHFDCDEAVAHYHAQIDQTSLTAAEKKKFKKELETVLTEGTYLEPAYGAQPKE